MQMLSVIPALPVRNLEKSIPFYRDIVDLSLRHHNISFAIFYRDTVEVHVWQALDEAGGPAAIENRSRLALSRSFPERQAAASQSAE